VNVTKTAPARRRHSVVVGGGGGAPISYDRWRGGGGVSKMSAARQRRRRTALNPGDATGCMLLLLYGEIDFHYFNFNTSVNTACSFAVGPIVQSNALNMLKFI